MFLKQQTGHNVQLNILERKEEYFIELSKIRTTRTLTKLQSFIVFLFFAISN